MSMRDENPSAGPSSVFRSEPLPDDFCEPETLEEAEVAFAAAVARVQSIQSDLGCKRRYLPDGSEMPYREFADWKRRAKFALMKAVDEQRRLKVCLARFRQSEHTAHAGRRDQKLLARCGQFLEGLDSSGSLSHEGQDLLAAIRRAGFTRGFFGEGVQ